MSSPSNAECASEMFLRFFILRNRNQISVCRVRASGMELDAVFKPSEFSVRTLTHRYRDNSAHAAVPHTFFMRFTLVFPKFVTILAEG